MTQLKKTLMNYKELLEVGKEAALQAGQLLVKNKGKKKKVLSELGRDIKLELDSKTERIICNALNKTNIPVLGEELSANQNKAGLFWVVDPIDGTANYFRGLDQCCVSIALMKDEEAIIGIIFNFNTNEMFHGLKGDGSYLNNIKIKVSKINDKAKASLTTGFPSSEDIDSSTTFIDFLKNWKKIRMFGSAALSCAYVASGRCDFYTEKGVYLWDFAAGICLVSEAGGSVNYAKIDNERYNVQFSNGCL
tara:strand:- start:645 stop:1391 length:747 start_codon:yes stop_codon:yes gene_type:complete